MCLSNVYEIRGEERHLLAKNIADIREDNGELILTDIMGIRTKLYADIEKVDLLENFIIVKPYNFDADSASTGNTADLALADGDASNHEHSGEHSGEDSPGHSHKHSHQHSPEEKKKQINRISRAIGHCKHVKKLIDSDADCSEVLVQLSAVNAALRNLGKEIINEHMSHCITHAIENGDTSAVEEFQEAVKRFI